MISVDGETIYRAETFYSDVKAEFEGPLPVALWAARNFTQRGMVFREPKRAADGMLAYARVDHGRWVVDCPAARCRAAQVASETDTRFYCHICQNAEQGGAWIKVRWPKRKERDEIETLLLLRPLPEQRNWSPGETLAMLRDENVAHGCSIRTEG